MKRNYGARRKQQSERGITRWRTNINFAEQPTTLQVQQQGYERARDDAREEDSKLLLPVESPTPSVARFDGKIGILRARSWKKNCKKSLSPFRDQIYLAISE